MNTPHVASLVLTLALTAPTLAQGGHLRTVPSTLVEIQWAIDQSADGDLIQVVDHKPSSLGPTGIYAPITIDGKSLTIVANVPDGSRPQVDALTIRNLQATQEVILRGFDFAVPASGSAPLELLVENCAGHVWFEDCVFRTLDDSTTTTLTVVNSGQLSMHRCQVQGKQTPIPGAAGIAFDLEAGQAALYDCTIAGGRGVNGTAAVSGSPGAAGLLHRGGYLNTGSCTISGGAGGKGLLIAIPGMGLVCSNGGDGGDALTLLAATCAVTSVRSTLAGGAGGSAGGSCTGGLSGADVVTGPGSFQELDSGTPNRSFVIDPAFVSSSAESLSLTIRGDAGDIVVLGYTGFGGEPTFAFASHGAIVIPPLAIANLGVIPGSGVLTVTSLTPWEGGPLTHELMAQPVFVSPQGVLTPGPASAIVIF